MAAEARERAILRLTRAFLDRGLAVDLVVVQAVGKFAHDVPSGARVVDLRAPRALLAIPRLIAYLRASAPDVLISAQNHVNLVAVPAWVLSRAANAAVPLGA